MKGGVVESKFKYMLGKLNINSILIININTFVIGEPFKDKFEGITINDAATESNFIRSNGIFTAVIHNNSITINNCRSHGNLLEVV